MLQEVPSVFIRVIIEMAWAQLNAQQQQATSRPGGVSRFALAA